MKRSRIYQYHLRRKRVITSFFVIGLLLIGLVSGMFYQRLTQERGLSAIDPPELQQSADSSAEDSVRLERLFEPASEASVEVRQLHDKQRRDNIDAIHEALQARWQEKTRYPRLSELNSAGYRSGAFPELDEDVFLDPDKADRNIAITRTPQATVYAYNVVDENGYTCEIDVRVCVGYELAAILSDGSVYMLTGGTLAE